MQLHLGTSSEFDKSLHEIKGKYGKEMIELEGLTPEQLDPLRFFRNFVGSKTVADISSDASSNVNGKNMNTMISESNKPLSKLLCYNKMFVEIEEKKGLDRAKEWLEQSINGGIYNHDASTITTKSYCYYGKENIVIKYKNKISCINFEDLYEILNEEEVFLDNECTVKCKYSDKLQVKDIVNGKEVWTKVIRVMYKPKPEGIHLRNIKYSNGLSQIVTDEHPIITTNRGDVPAENIQVGDKVYTHKYTNVFTDNIKEINDFKLNKDLGWLLGMILAEGGLYLSEGKYEFVSFCQSFTQNSDIINHVFDVVKRLDITMNYHIDGEEKYIFNTSNKDFVNLYKEISNGLVSYEKRLDENFIHWDKSFLYGLFSGLFDGDGNLEGFEKRRCMLRLSTRTLLNQMSLFLQEEGYTVRNRTPYLKNRKGSFITRKTMYGMGFTLSEKEDLIKNFNSLKISKEYVPLKRNWNSKNKQYASTYGEVSVIKNEIIESLNEEVYVYDISTETGHFLQNSILSHNCFAMTFEDIVTNGLWWEEGMSSKAPKHIKTFNSHIFQTLSKMANNLSGAVGMPDVLIYMYYFLMKDIETGYLDKKDIVREREQSWQEFIFNLNQNYLRESGTQSCYSNISVFDRDYFIGMFGEKTFPDGTMMIEHIEPFMQYQKDFLEYETKLRREKFFTFPVITASIIFKDNKFQDEDFVRYIAEHNIEFGDANVYISDTADNLSSCCRLKNDTSLLKGNFNSIGGTSLSIGSVKVITLNLVRCALESKNEEEFYKNVAEKTALVHDALEVQRSIIEKNIAKGLSPLNDAGLIQLKNQYSTVGINGIFEAVKLLGGIEYKEETGYNYTEKGKQMAIKIMNVINDLNVARSQELGFTFNMEQVPFESGSVKHYKKDRLLYQDRIDNEIGTGIYGNQWIPLNIDCSLFHRLEMSALLDKEASGGAILHINRSNKITPEQNYENMIAYAKMGIVYYSDIIKMNICENDHTYTQGSDICPICGGKKVDEAIKVVGYIVRKSAFQKERKKEMDERVFYKN